MIFVTGGNNLPACKDLFYMKWHRSAVDGQKETLILLNGSLPINSNERKLQQMYNLSINVKVV